MQSIWPGYTVAYLRTIFAGACVYIYLDTKPNFVNCVMKSAF